MTCVRCSVTVQTAMRLETRTARTTSSHPRRPHLKLTPIRGRTGSAAFRWDRATLWIRHQGDVARQWPQVIRRYVTSFLKCSCIGWCTHHVVCCLAIRSFKCTKWPLRNGNCWIFRHIFYWSSHPRHRSVRQKLRTHCLSANLERERLMCPKWCRTDS